MKQIKSLSKVLIRSSAAEYLAFAAAIGEQKNSIELRYQDENLWLTQKLMSELYGVSVSAIRQHLDKLILDNEIDSSTIKQYLIVQKEGSRTITRNRA